jgi:hypothetical protein
MPSARHIVGAGAIAGNGRWNWHRDRRTGSRYKQHPEAGDHQHGRENVAKRVRRKNAAAEPGADQATDTGGDEPPRQRDWQLPERGPGTGERGDRIQKVVGGRDRGGPTRLDPPHEQDQRGEKDAAAGSSHPGEETDPPR